MFPKPPLLPGNRQDYLALIQHAADNACPTLHPMQAMAMQLCGTGGPAAVSILSRLLETHASTVEARGVAGNTLLHCAAQSGNAELVGMLISHAPALCTTLNDAGARPYDLATCERVRALLRMASPASAPAADCPMAEANAVLEEDECSSLYNLPEELLVLVLMQLEPCHVLRVRESCRKLRAVADVDAVWECLCWTSYRRAARTSCLYLQTYREIFIEHTLLQCAIKTRKVADRHQRYLDRRSLAGLESVEAPDDAFAALRPVAAVAPPAAAPPAVELA